MDTDKVLEIIRETRKISFPKWGNVEPQFKEKDFRQYAGSIVTEVDLKVEEYLRNSFLKLDNTVGFRGEETGGVLSKERFWLVDPIDGTGHFVRGIPFCTTMVSFIEDGHVTFAAIYDFIKDVMYHAERGKGAYQNNERISVSKRPLSEAYVSREMNTSNPDALDLSERVRSLCNCLNTISAGYEFVLVATGKIEARINYKPFGKDYDFAPGSLLVSEAGGVVTNIGKSDYDYRNTNLIAANPVVHKELTEGENALFPIT